MRSSRDLAAAAPHPAGDGEKTLPLSQLGPPASPARPAAARTAAWSRLVRQHLPLTAVLGLAIFMRFWALAAIGFNSDEAVYTGSAASLAGDSALRTMFPVFRAHPVLLQALLSLILRIHESDWTARALTAAVGVVTVTVTYLLGRRLYGRNAGLLAALLLAVTPYHVVVSRQVLLDGLMTLFATAALYCVAAYVETGSLTWLLAAGGTMGAAVLTKETSLVLLGGLYAFFVLTPSARMHARHLLLAIAVLGSEVAVWPLALRLSGHTRTGQGYLLWQLFRRANHGTWFYFTVLPSWIGPAAIAVAAVGLIWLRREATWRERLLLAWLVVPVVFFTLWPVKGFEYLLPISPPIALLAGRTLARSLPLPRWAHTPGWARMPRWARTPRWARMPRWAHTPGWTRVMRTRPGVAGRVAMGAVSAAVAASLAIPAWGRIEPSASATFLAGSGGLAGGRQAGQWVLHHIPQGARLLAIGPSMANVLEFYGHHRVFALSVSTDARNRNPVYTPVPNPDLALREGFFQYVVWDAYTAARSRFFAADASRLAAKYHGVAVYTSTVTVRSPSGTGVAEPVIVIYQVHP